jgi:signal transduction histidine kinase
VDAVTRTYIPLRQIKWRFVLSAFAVVLICLFFYRQLDFVANGAYRSPLLTFAEELIGCIAGLGVFPLIYSVAIRFPLLSDKWRRNVAVHLIALCLISIIHTTLIATLRAVFFPLLGLHEGYGNLLVRYPMEFAHLFIFYWAGVSLIYLFHEVRFAREREIAQARLQATLAESQLENLRLQLEPHFLFNTLNAISAVVYEDARVADEMIGRLSELLRRLLKSEHSQEVPLSREVELLRLYTHIMKARFEERLQLSFSLDESAKDALVPQFLLQPLVENCIRHGIDPGTFQAVIEIRTARVEDHLVITVRDHGTGIACDQPRSQTGIGLRNTAERLWRLYGKDQRFHFANAADGGAVAEIVIPFRLAPATRVGALAERVPA